MLNGDLRPNETVTMELHTPAGEVIRVRDVGYYRDTDTLVFEGRGTGDSLCQIIAKVQGLQVMFRVVTLPEDQPRKRVGFNVYEEQEQPAQTETAPSIDRQELMDLMVKARTPAEVTIARAAADSYLASAPSDGDVRVARDHLPDPTGD